MDDKLVSIIIPAYNVEDYIEECVRSVLQQTYKDYEIIIIDDGSTDKTFEICENLKCSKIKIYQQKNEGVSCARNRGMEYANGDYYVFVDADDVVSTKYVETLVRSVRNVDMAIIGYTCCINEIDKETDASIRTFSANVILDKLLCGTDYDGYLWNKIFKSSIIQQNNIQFEQNITIWEDMYFVLEYLKFSKKVNVMGSKLYFYRDREGSTVHGFQIDKYRSKYQIMKKIKNGMFDGSEQSRKRTLYVYYETMLSYINKAFRDRNEMKNAYSILKKISFTEIVMQKNFTFIFKFLFLKYKAIFLIQSIIDADNMERRRQQFKDH